MKLAVHHVFFDYEGGPTAIGPGIADFGKAADEVGLDAISVMDHYWQMIQVGGPELNMLEAYTTLGFLAASTTDCELQVLVTGPTYRHPGLLAKIISTLDVLSGGRAVLGIGAAWYEEEHVGLGVPFPSTAERFERLEETLQITRQMWSRDESGYAGKHYQLGRTLNVPQPVRTPPIMIGGGGERKTLRMVAKYGDATNLFGGRGDQAAISHKLEVLRGHCEREGTDYDRLRKTLTWAANPMDPIEDSRAFLDELRGYADIGIDQLFLMPASQPGVGQYVRRLGEIVPKVHEI
ncbi:MAG: LLM class F420-dependent oxidoreductase [Nocardioidaceae bacterium]|nr:MAG: LLM class F420-dependent oxidoreductase [Nocardioidaceae bacterium]